MSKQIIEHEQKLHKESVDPEGRGTVDKIDLRLSFDTPLGSEQEVVEVFFRNHPDVAKQVGELSARSRKLQAILNQEPELAKQFTEDPLAVLGKVFPELELQLPIEKPVETERFHVVLQPTAPASDGAFHALRRALEFVVASPNNATVFEADPLGTFYQINVGQQASDVERAAQALELALGIYRIERLPIEDWVYASNSFLTMRGTR